MSVDEEALADHLEEVVGPGTLQELSRLGEGVHGVGYRVVWDGPDGPEPLILKQIHPEGFGHEYLADRAQVLFLAHEAYDQLPDHVESVDLLGQTPDGIVSMGDVEEVLLLMEEATGTPYAADLDRILDDGELADGDREKVEAMAAYLAGIHAETHDDPALYRRRIRDTVGDGECLLGIVDSYPEAGAFLDQTLLEEVAAAAGRWWATRRDFTDRLCQVHGDYHPGNIWWEGDEMTVLDRSRGIWGEPADDVVALAINHIFYALRDRDAFEGPFAELFHAFLDAYVRETGDDDLYAFMGGFLAFRVAIVAHPTFYPQLSDRQRVRLFRFAVRAMEAGRFDPAKVDQWLEG